MERLTMKNLSNWNYLLCANVTPKRKDMNPAFKNAINKLGAYEDTGLTPEQIQEGYAELQKLKKHYYDAYKSECKKNGELREKIRSDKLQEEKHTERIHEYAKAALKEGAEIDG